MPGVLGHALVAAHRGDTGNCREVLVEEARARGSPPGVLRESLELWQEDRRLELGQSIVPAENLVLVPGAAGHAPDVSIGPAPFEYVAPIGDDRASFTGGDVLAGLKAEGA